MVERAPDVAARSGVGGERLDFVQALRGIAAIAVVMYHARLWIVGPGFSDAGDRLFRNGAAGVDLFFVISGFIMVHTTWHSPGGVRNAGRFLARRLARIWPVYVIATFAFIVAEGSVWHWLTTRSGLLHLGKAFVFYPVAPGGAPFFGWTPNGVGWTLDYEIWFYLLFAIALVAGRRRWAVLVGLFTLFLVAVPRLYTGHVDADAYFEYQMSPVILRLAASSMVWEFLAGAAIGAIYRSRLRIENRAVLGAFAAMAMTAVLWQHFAGHGHHGMVGWGPALIVMVLALALWNKASPISVPRPLLWLGDVSFSLYLVHRIAQRGVDRLVPPPESVVGGVGFVLMTTGIALVLAQLSYRYLEAGIAERFRRWLLRRLG